MRIAMKLHDTSRMFYSNSSAGNWVKGFLFLSKNLSPNFPPLRHMLGQNIRHMAIYSIFFYTVRRRCSHVESQHQAHSRRRALLAERANEGRSRAVQHGRRRTARAFEPHGNRAASHACTADYDSRVQVVAAALLLRWLVARGKYFCNEFLVACRFFVCPFTGIKVCV